MRLTFASYRPRVSVVLVALLLAAACSGSEDAARAEALSLELVDCDRFTLTTRVDASAASDLVAADQTPRRFSGDSMFSFHALACDELVTDGVNHGAGYFATVWVLIEDRPGDLTLPDSTDLVARPSDTMAPLLWQTDNDGFHDATADFGIPMTLVESVTFGPPSAAGPQQGGATGAESGLPLTYQWTVDNQAEGKGGVGRHLLLGSDDQGEPLVYYGEFHHEFGWLGNPGTLEFEPGSVFDEVTGNRLTGSANGNPISVDMIAYRPGAGS